jgi:hypothetical protein
VLRIDGWAAWDDDPRAHRYPFAVWIDEGGPERVPVRIEIESGFGGWVRLDLVAYDPPGSLLVASGSSW